MHEVLRPAEWEGAERIRHLDIRLSCLRAECAFRIIPSAHLHVPLRDLQMTVSRFGKPRLPALDVEVSQSHSHDWSAVAVSALSLVGIDGWRPPGKLPPAGLPNYPPPRWSWEVVLTAATALSVSGIMGDLSSFCDPFADDRACAVPKRTSFKTA